MSTKVRKLPEYLKKPGLDNTLCESKATLPYFIVAILTKILNMSDYESSLFSNQTSNVKEVNVKS